MQISVCAKKGGVGKTTVSLLLYYALADAGKDVALSDWDPQGTATQSLSRNEGRLWKPGETPELLIVDTAPYLQNPHTIQTLRASDTVLIVTTPSPADLWEAGEAVAFAREINPTAKIRLVLNKVRSGTFLTKNLLENEQKSLPAEPVKHALALRESYQHALLAGWKGLDGVAKNEVLKFVLAAISLKR